MESRKYLKIYWLLPAFLFTLSFFSFSVKSFSTGLNQPSDVPKKEFYCPPCGCSGDHLIHAEPGSCPVCHMPLLEMESGFKQHLRDISAPVFQNANVYSEYYVRIIYPLIIFQCLLIALLLINTRLRTKIVFFSMFILSMSFYMLKFQLYGTIYALNISERALYFPITFIALTWPSLYLYFKSTNTKIRFKSKEVLLHFLPAGIIWMLNIILFLSFPRSSQFLYNSFESFLTPGEQMIFILGAFIYAPEIIKIAREKGSPNELTWMRNLLVFPVIIAFVMLVLVSINGYLYSFMSSTLDYHLLWLVMTLSIPWFSYLIWKKREDLFKRKPYEAPRIPDHKIEIFKKKILSIMDEQKPYLDPEFDLHKFATLAEISVKEMSELLKNGFNSGFYDFVNLYRINEVKRMLLDPDYLRYTNFAIAEKAGFRSKSTFISYFKKHAGMTPKEYKVYNGLIETTSN